MTRRAANIIIAVVLALAVPSLATAYWTGVGFGTATGSVAGLSQTTLTAASPSASLVDLEWSAVTVQPDGEDDEVTYAVERRLSGGTWTPACGTATAPLEHGDLSCRDTVDVSGDYEYRVTGRFRTWTSSATDAVTVVADNTRPSVTVEQKPGQADPARALPIRFSVRFSEAVEDFDATDVVRGGTASTAPGNVSVTGSGRDYEIVFNEPPAISDGTITASVASGAAHDAAGNPNTASTSDDNQVRYDATAPSVTVEQAPGQADPTRALPILYAVTFSEPVTGFDVTDLTRTGTATGGTVSVTGGGAGYEISVSGTLTNGTIGFSVGAGRAHDAAANPNVASTGDGTVTYDTVAPTFSKAEMFDDDHDGVVDTVEVTFSETLGGAGSISHWTLSGSPTGSNAMTVAPAASGSTVTLRTTGATVNTARGSFTIGLQATGGGVRDEAGNLAGISPAQPVTDKAQPVPVAVTDDDTATTGGTAANNGLFQSNDHMTVTFSEPMSVPSSTTSDVILTGGDGSAHDTLVAPGLLMGSAGLGSAAYIAGNGTQARWASSAISRLSGSNTNQIRLSLTTCTPITANACSSLTQNTADAPLVLTPDGANLKDQATVPNPAAASSTNPSFSIRLF